MARRWNPAAFRGAIVLILLVGSRSGTSEAAPKRTTVIAMEKAGRGVNCKVGSKSFDDLLRAYGEVLDRHGPDQPVAVLIDDALPISWIWVARGLAAKAPLTNVRVFVAMRANGNMFEINPAPSVPIGTPIE